MSTKVNVKDRVEDNTIDLSLSELTEVPVREIVSPSLHSRLIAISINSNANATWGVTREQRTEIILVGMLSRNF